MNHPLHRAGRRILRGIAPIALAAGLALGLQAQVQQRPYIGYVYPAGGQQGTKVQIRLGGQGLDDVHAVLVTGSGVTGRVLDHYRRLNPQENQLINEQLRELRKAATPAAPARSARARAAGGSDRAPLRPTPAQSSGDLMARIERRLREHVATPACVSIANLAFLEITITPNAEPGEREIRLVTPRGVSNPLPFHVGQLTEHTRKPMTTAALQMLGKEELALRKRPLEEIEVRIDLPCTLNGQIASGEVNRYRFAARQGQRLVVTTLARQLVPYIADAVPGWFQPVLILRDDQGKEVAFADDYRFKPDPVLRFEAPRDGEYVIEITDAIYRGREDFVYRLSVGELPFLSSLFPLGARAGAPATPSMKGWNLDQALLAAPPANSSPGLCWLTAKRDTRISNPMPFALGTLPEHLEKEANNGVETAQKVALPLMMNGRIDRPDDWDVFEFTGAAGSLIAVGVQARRLDSPLDSVIKLTDASGRVLAFNDDREDLGAGLHTHSADSWFMARLPAAGVYFIHIGDTARQGGEEYGYRLRLSAPQPDFELRVVPSSIALRGRSSTTVTVFAQRMDGFSGPIQLSLRQPLNGFSATPVTLASTQTTARLTIRTTLPATSQPVDLSIVGAAQAGGRRIVREAVPAEDRMQAFLWRHLVPARDLKAMVLGASNLTPAKRPLPQRPAVSAPAQTASSTGSTGSPPAFTKAQVAGRLRQLRLLYEDGFLSSEFYLRKVAECEAVQ